MLFILSLPRAGSTLLQRLLMGHAQIGSCGEPWLALPLVKLSDPETSFSTFGHASVVRSLEHLFDLLPEGRNDYLESCGALMEDVYRKTLRGRKVAYFLDKTPRYYQIIPELAEMFPDAKFIILRRKLPAVYASILNYVGGNTMYLPTWRQDIVEGVPALAHGQKILGSKAHCIDYEKLVADPSGVLREALSFLDLPWSDKLGEELSNSSVPRGDPTGIKKYKNVSLDSLESWKKTIDSTTKKREGLKWLSCLRNDATEGFGVSLEKQIIELRGLKVSMCWRDALRLILGKLYFNSQFNVIRWGFLRRKIRRSCTLY